MNAAVIGRAQDRVAQAETAYQSALEQGAGTQEARDRLARAQADAAAVRNAAAKEAEQAEAARRERLIDEACVAVGETERQMAAQLLQMDVPDLTIALPTEMMVAILEARHKAAEAAQAAGEATAKALRIRDRLDELARRRSAIVARRQAGDGDDARDAAEVALIQADSEGLAGLLQAAELAAAEPTRRAAEATAAVTNAEVLWNQAVQVAHARALAGICQALDAALVRAATALYPHRHASGVSAWKPSHGLRYLCDFGSPDGRLP